MIRASGFDIRNSGQILREYALEDNCLVIVHTVAARHIVIAVSPTAALFGIRSGMTLTQARALHANIEHLEHEPHRDAVALEALARWMMRYSPCVALFTVGIEVERTFLSAIEGHSRPSIPRGKKFRASKFVQNTPINFSPAVDINQTPAIWLDMTGTDRLFGPAEKILNQLESALKRWGITCRLALSHTPGAAWAMTFECRHGGTEERHAGTQARRHEGTEDISLPLRLRASVPSCLPIISLRLPADVVDALHHLGVLTIGQLRKLPRDQLPSRFGSIILSRLNQLDGVIDEPLVPIEPLWPIVADRRWEEPVESLELIWPIARELIEQIADKLLRRGHGAREMRATLKLTLGPAIEKTIRFSRPTREVHRMFELFQQAVGSSPSPGNPGKGRGEGSSRFGKRRCFSFRSPPCPPLGVPKGGVIPADLSAFDFNGYVAVRLEITRSQRIVTEQIQLGQTGSFEGEIEMGDLIERIHVRLGQECMVQSRPIESHVPERAWEECRHEGTKARRHEVTEDSLLPSCLRAYVPTCLSVRPLQLHDPVELRVIVSPSHDRDGRPISLTDPAGGVHRIAHAVGPERIAGQWWIGHGKSRDYFDVELPDGRRWWIFRVNENGRWFLQGEF